MFLWQFHINRNYSLFAVTRNTNQCSVNKHCSMVTTLLPSGRNNPIVTGCNANKWLLMITMHITYMRNWWPRKGKKHTIDEWDELNRRSHNWNIRFPKPQSARKTRSAQQCNTLTNFVPTRTDFVGCVQRINRKLKLNKSVSFARCLVYWNLCISFTRAIVYPLYSKVHRARKNVNQQYSIARVGYC